MKNLPKSTKENKTNLPTNLPYQPSNVNDKSKFLLPQAVEYILESDWIRVEHYIEQDPSLARREVIMVCQGENSKGLLLHLVCTRRHAPISVIDALITANPNALLQKDTSGGRLPLHVATLKGAPCETIQHLIRARPQALSMPDQEGNLPVHHAAQYSTPIFKLLLAEHPQGAQVSNNKGRLPLHLLCTHCFDLHVAPQELKDCYDAYPQAIQSLDRYGRIPLHLACQAHPRWDLLQVLMERYPEGLTVKDKSGQIPYQLAKLHYSHNQRDVVLCGLSDATVRERRKKGKFLPCFSLNYKKRKKKMDVDLFDNCYG